jgi:tetratricopeptide (TPR) repeat protein
MGDRGKALDRNRRNTPIWIQYGHVLKEPGELVEAEIAYRTAIAHDPNVADWHLQLGNFLGAQNKKEEAQASYLRALALDPSLPDLSRELRALGWLKTEVSQVGITAGSDESGTDLQEIDLAQTLQSNLAHDDRLECAEEPISSGLRSIAYITNAHDPATMRYRVDNYAHIFAGQGMAVTTIDYSVAQFRPCGRDRVSRKNRGIHSGRHQ